MRPSLRRIWAQHPVKAKKCGDHVLPKLETVVKDIVERLGAREDRGTVASYIPELAKVSPAHFGMAVVTADGEMVVAGDADVPFSIQSVSKVFTLTLALGKVGDQLWNKVGREPSGNPFNSIVQLENEKGKPRNPFINAGAIAVTDVLLAGHQPREVLGEILRFCRFVAEDDSVMIDEHVARSEKTTGFLNTALANYMKAFKVLENPVEHALGVYFHLALCRSLIYLSVSCRGLCWP